MGIGLAVLLTQFQAVEMIVVMTLQKLYVNHKIDAEEAKITDT